MLDIEERPDAVIVALAHGKVNALDTELLRAIEARFRGLAEDTRPVVLTGTGRAFSAGVDLQRLVEGGPSYVREFMPALSDAFLAVFEHPGPVVAAINGHALAGGCIFAAACDVRIAADVPAALGVTELLVGVPFPATPLEIMRHAVGDPVASHMAFTGRRFDVAEAYRIGLVHEIVDAAALRDTALARAAELGALRRPAYVMAKRQLRAESVERMRRGRAETDPGAHEVWESTETADAIRRYLASLKDRPAPPRGGR